MPQTQPSARMLWAGRCKPSVFIPWESAQAVSPTEFLGSFVKTCQGWKRTHLQPDWPSAMLAQTPRSEYSHAGITRAELCRHAVTLGSNPTLLSTLRCTAQASVSSGSNYISFSQLCLFYCCCCSEKAAWLLVLSKSRDLCLPSGLGKHRKET